MPIRFLGIYKLYLYALYMLSWSVLQHSTTAKREQGAAKPKPSTVST